jgi:hypothetical protein
VTVTVTLYIPVAVGVPHNSPSPGVMNPDVVPLPVRIEIPGGRPVAPHANGAVPPFLTVIPAVQGTPMVQSLNESPYGAIDGGVGGTPTTLIDIDFVYDTLLLSFAVMLTP